MKVPTAEEFATEHNNARMPRGVDYSKDIGELMIDFAELHVRAALENVLSSMTINGEPLDDSILDYIDETSITESYPKENIK